MRRIQTRLTNTNNYLPWRVNYEMNRTFSNKPEESFMYSIYLLGQQIIWCLSSASGDLLKQSGLYFLPQLPFMLWFLFCMLSFLFLDCFSHFPPAYPPLCFSSDLRYVFWMLTLCLNHFVFAVFTFLSYVSRRWLKTEITKSQAWHISTEFHGTRTLIKHCNMSAPDCQSKIMSQYFRGEQKWFRSFLGGF